MRLRSGARPQAHLIDYKTFLPDSPAAVPDFFGVWGIGWFRVFLLRGGGGGGVDFELVLMLGVFLRVLGLRWPLLSWLRIFGL